MSRYIRSPQEHREHVRLKSYASTALKICYFVMVCILFNHFRNIPVLSDKQPIGTS